MMITWVTVWVLTVTTVSANHGVNTHYQLTYANQKTCLNQIKKYVYARCDFQQVPVVINK